jgi:hypothetical protein
MSHLMKVIFGNATIMNTYASNVKITTTNNGMQILQELQKLTFWGGHVSLSFNCYLLFGCLGLRHLYHMQNFRGNVLIRNRRRRSTIDSEPEESFDNEEHDSTDGT